MSFDQNAARDLAGSALLHIAGDPGLVSAFLGATGLQPGDLRAMAGGPDLPLHVLDFLLEDDSRVLEAASALAVRPQDLMAARTALSGPGSFGWDPD